MERLLIKLNYEKQNARGCSIWYKKFSNFKIAIMQVQGGKQNYLASIMVKGVEILLPNAINRKWLLEFENDNI